MFIQVIQGKVTDAARLRAALDQWVAELSDGAAGWLGVTGGVTDDGTALTVVRFDSEAAARRNSDRPEQGEWWAETQRLYHGEVVFHDCPEVDTMLQGGSDEAGFVQIIQGRVTDSDRYREVHRQYESALSQFRPEIIGSTLALHSDGGVTETVYFTSEEAAREGERKELPAELQSVLDDENSLYEGEPTFFDLRDPWLVSAR